MLKAPEIYVAAVIGAAVVSAAVVGAAVVGAAVVSVDAVRANACVDNSSDHIVAGGNSCSATQARAAKEEFTTPTAKSINTATIFCIV